MTTLAGTIGLIMLLSAFILNLFKIMHADTIIYNILNIVGGGLLTYYALKLNSIPFLILEGVWAFFALYKLISISKKKQ